MAARPAWMLAVAGAAWLGALAARPLPLALAVTALTTAGLARRPLVLAGAVLITASCLGARAWDGLVPAPAARFDGSVTLISDPAPVEGGVRADVRTGGRHLEAWFHGPAAGEVRSLLAGERVVLHGEIAPRPAGATRLVARHVVGRLAVSRVVEVRPAAAPYRLANRLRRTLSAGLRDLDADEQALVLGVLLGDDRQQSATVTAEFRAAGLSHLLAVSGQNVAFVLVAVRPVVRRRGLRGRFALTVVVLVGFAFVTRFEPSVLRATAMAGVAAAAALAGRPAPTMHHLAVAVTGLVLVDPLLVHALGFQLSVAACAAILLLAGRMAAAIPGPRLVVEPLAVTTAAQIGVAPLLVQSFGGVPIAAIPANVVAAPAVAPLTIWGMVASCAIGAAGRAIPATLASAAQAPTRLFADWLLLVAHGATRADLGVLGGRELVGLAAGAGALLVARGLRSRSGRR
jgi:competence protein ComEC